MMDANGGDDLAQTAELWEALRGFLHRSEAVTRRHGLTPQRHQLLVMITAMADQHPTVTDLGRRMHLTNHGVSELITRAEAAGLVAREPSAVDARMVTLRVQPEGRRRLDAVLADLRSDRATLEAVVRALR
jgi:DNA-binding MarR family transcriptional regulator